MDGRSVVGLTRNEIHIFIMGKQKEVSLISPINLAKGWLDIVT